MDFKDFLESSLGTKPKNILIVAFHEWAMHLGSFLEIVEELNNLGHNVHVGLWGNETIFPDQSKVYPKYCCRIFQITTPQEQVEKIIKQKYPKIKFLSLGPKLSQKRYFVIGQKKIHFRDIHSKFMKPSGKGVAMAASLIGWSKRSEEVAYFKQNVVEVLSKSYDYVLENSYNVLTDSEIDVLIIFNGRFVHEHALMSAGKKSGVKILYYEAGGSDGKFDVYSHETLDELEIQKRMISSYAESKNPEKDLYAADWFFKRKSRHELEVSKFNSRQEIGRKLLTSDNKKILVFFSTSSDELLYSQEGSISPFGSQEEFLIGLSSLLTNHDEYLFVVRTHPNMRHKSIKTQFAWNRFISNLPNVIHLNQYSRVDSYALMEQADKIMVFGSTIGIESTFFGKDVLNVANCFYSELDAVKNAVNFDEVKAWLLTPFRNLNTEKCLPYGYFFRSRGFKFKSYLSIDDGFGKFAEYEIGRPLTIKRKVLAIENYLRATLW